MRDFIVDGHSDILLNYLRDEDYNFQKESKFHIDLPKLKEGNIGLEVFAACSTEKGSKALIKTINIVDKFNYLIKNTKEVEMVRSFSDIDNIINNGNIAALLAIEGADGILDLSILRIFYELGVRMITLTWNYRNHIADGVYEIKANGGITEFGQKFIKEMNRLGMIIDLAHLTPSSFWDVIKYSTGPIVVSHSNAKEICNHNRNLNNKQIEAIAERDGLIGINFCPQFIKNDQNAEVKDIIEHIEHIKNLVGIDYIGLGTDYDGIIHTPKKMENISKIPKLFKGLKNNGFSNTEIRKIKRDNWLRIFKQVL